MVFLETKLITTVGAKMLIFDGFISSMLIMIVIFLIIYITCG